MKRVGTRIGAGQGPKRVLSAGGMGPRPDPFRRPLAERGRSVVNVPSADASRPWWVAVGDAYHEGTVHAWYRDEATGEWHALVMVWLPGTTVFAAWPVS